MKNKEKILVIVFLVTGSLFLLLAYFSDNSSSATPDYSALYETTNKGLDFSSLKSGMGNLKGQESPFLVKSSESLNKKIALYVIAAKACSNCLNEVEEYVELIDKLNEQGLNIQQVAWFHSSDEAYSKQFATVSNFSITKGYSVTSQIPTSLLHFKDGFDEQQLLLINKNQQEVFYRIKLPTGLGTNMQTKKSILEQVFPGSLVLLNQ